ncbi:MAG TPA: CopG family transcriptional regulator [Cyanobacteria bacterium UBA11991]|nr:CopG family transcriptional regulator [Cyanobacteriota bacterium]MDY6359446.1 CopG family transcriptional regulator [Cyanobacteriota bacterium]MDY6363420.1 CopG family transcriptional regulator [Cyanobacteriota bacterium]MDY6382519.1 CopG family transcriptional regulator [Cyanobacteriota bacterium]HCB10725.1 CopG family transcriptional regulator [Cyanobacteria bacterium UBA11991]
MAEQFSLRLPKGTKERLQQLANATGRTKAFLAQDAIEKYLELEAWQIQAIQDGIKSVDNGQVVSYEDIKHEWGI